VDVRELKLGLKNGDLLFVTAKDSGLSGAINNVTQKEKMLLLIILGFWKKLMAVILYFMHLQKRFRQAETERFYRGSKKDGQDVFVYRLKPEYQNAIPDAIAKANSMLGKPYNFNYILNEDSYYCSDFIERIFRKDHIFNLEPMTFIDPKTGKTNEFWEKFYQKKNLKFLKVNWAVIRMV
jgi:hypothetical protein